MVDPATLGPRDHSCRARPLLRTMLGEVLRRTRHEQRRTLADVASIARVSLPYLSELERGRKEASSEVLAAICDALHIDLADLLAQVGHDLIGHRDRRPAVIRLDRVRDDGRAWAGEDNASGLPPDQAVVLGTPDATMPGPASAPTAFAGARCLQAA